MPLRLNLSGNDYLAPAGGYPFRLWPGGKLMAEGVIPKHAKTVTASVYTESGSSDVHLAIYATPSESRGADGELIVTRDEDDDSLILQTYQADANAIGSEAQDLTLTLPTDREPAVYVVRLWTDNITGQIAETADRDDDSTASDEPAIPTGVVVESVVIA